MIDLRSDTLTLPTPPMLQTIESARFGDSGRWNAERRGEDPTMNELEDLAAEMMGKEAAVFCNSGTMGNLTALLTCCRPGDTVLIDERQHLYRTEKGAFSPRLGQLQAVTYKADEDGNPDVADIMRQLENKSVKLVCVENSHNNRGGQCMPLPVMKEIYQLAQGRGVHVHLDGARIFNAALTLGVTAREIAQHSDSVMFCVSKGLGAPVGSLVCGAKDFIYQLRETRRLLGGDMRQSGVLAAPALYALKHNIARLAEDNAHAAQLVRELQNLSVIQLPAHVQTNIVMLTVPSGRADELKERLSAHGIVGGAVDESRVRLVFHQEISDADTRAVIDRLRLIDAEMSAC